MNSFLVMEYVAGEPLTGPLPLETRISLGGTLAYRMLRYDVTRDGSRFLINSEPESAVPSQASITVLLNWTAMLKA